MSTSPTHARPLTTTLAVALAFAAGCTGGTKDDPREARKEPAPAIVPGALSAAHGAYLEGDFVKVGERVRDVILDPAATDLVKENAYELLEKAYEAQGGQMPSAFAMPQGFEMLQYGCIYARNPHGSTYRVYARGRMHDAGRITGLTIRRLPDETILDKATGKGRYKIEQVGDGREDFVLDSGALEAPPSDGVYSMRFELTDGSTPEGWFIVHGLVPSSTPEVLSPESTSSLSDPNPVIRWNPFRTAQYAAFERRSIDLYVSSDKIDGLPWQYWAWDPGELSQARIGDHAGSPKTKLAPGAYWLAVGAAENRWFGPVRLVRSGRTDVPFHVLP